VPGCPYCNPIFVAAMFLTLTKWLRLLLWHFSLQQPHKQRTEPTRHPNTNANTEQTQTRIQIQIQIHRTTNNVERAEQFTKCVSKSTPRLCATRYSTHFPLTRSVLSKLLDCHYQAALLIPINLLMARSVIDLSWPTIDRSGCW